MKNRFSEWCLYAAGTLGLATAACQVASSPPQAAVDYTARSSAFPLDGAGGVSAAASAGPSPSTDGKASGASSTPQPTAAETAAAGAPAKSEGNPQSAAPAAAGPSSPAPSAPTGAAGSASTPTSTSPIAAAGNAAATAGAESVAQKGAAGVAAPPTTGTGTAGADAAASAGSEAPAPEPVKATKLTVEFTTKTYGGEFGPPNVGAVWVEDASGKWVYTLEEWCGWLNTLNLTVYAESGAEDYAQGLFPGTYSSGEDPPADVITSPTLTNHKTHKGLAWTFKNVKGAEVPDGMYTLHFEFTEEDDPGKLLNVPFMKGAPVGPVMATSAPGYADVKIALE